jgi:WD40 repeat protein
MKELFRQCRPASKLEPLTFNIFGDSAVNTSAGGASESIEKSIWPDDDISEIQVLRNYLLSGSNDRTIRLINGLTGHCIFTFSGHTAPIIAVQYAWNDDLEDLLRSSSSSSSSQGDGNRSVDSDPVIAISTSRNQISEKEQKDQQEGVQGDPSDSSKMSFLKRSWSSLHDDPGCIKTIRHFWSMSRDGSVIKWDLITGSVLSVKLSMQASFLALMVLLRE